MGGTVDQVVELDRPAALGPPELVADIVERPLHLAHDALGLVGVVGNQVVLGLLERAVLLLDEERLAGPIDDREVELTEHGLTGPFPRPVDAVEDRVVVGESRLEHAQGRDLVAIGAGQLQPGDVSGNDARHSAAPLVARSVSRQRDFSGL